MLRHIALGVIIRTCKFRNMPYDHIKVGGQLNFDTNHNNPELWFNVLCPVNFL